jgi:hypothetical protein
LPGHGAGDPEDRKQLGASYFDLGDRLYISGIVLADRLVGYRDLRLELIEQGIVKIGPPVALRGGIRGGGLGPSLRRLLLELPGYGSARPMIVGTHHAGTQSGGQDK